MSLPVGWREKSDGRRRKMKEVVERLRSAWRCWEGRFGGACVGYEGRP